MRSTNSELDIARARLKASGISIKQWADRHGFSAANVHTVLQGKSKAKHGEGFKIAVALGLKDRPPIEDAPEFIKKMLVARDLEAPEMPTPSLQEIAQEQPTEFLHQRLRNERLRVGLSQRELAALGEVSRPSQVGYECGKTDPTISYLRKIQNIIDVRRVLFDDAGRII